MTSYRFWIMTFVVLSLFGDGLVYQSRIAEYNDAQATLALDQQRLEDAKVLVSQQAPLTKVYTELARRYMKTARTTAKTESDFTRVVAMVAKKHDVAFVDALFKAPIPAVVSIGSSDASLPPTTPGAVGMPTPAPGAAANAALAAAAAGGGATSGLVMTPSDPGDPSIGRPAIDGSLFTRIPVNIKLTGDWKPLIATIQEMSTHSIFMAFRNPVVTSEHGHVALALDAELLDPAIPAVPGLAVDTKTRSLSKRPGHPYALAPRPHPAHHVTIAQR